MSLEYQKFLSRSADVLGSHGAQVLLAPDSRLAGAAWTRGWDLILMDQSPGPPTVYAFTEGDGISKTELQERVDRLAQGLASNGGLNSVRTNLTMVAGFNRESEASDQARKLKPSQYHPGLVPSVWVADLQTQRLRTGSWRRSPPAADQLREAMASLDAPAISTADVEVARSRHEQRAEAFHNLIHGRQPYVTYALVAFNVSVFLLLFLKGGPQDESTLRTFGALSPRLIEDGQWWRLISSMFLHASVAHILFNMTSLFAVGTLAERLYGSGKFLAIYLGAGLIGSLASFGYALSTGNLDTLGVGASGAIFGVAAALVTVRFQPSDVIPRQLKDRVSSSMLPLVVLSLAISYLVPHVDNSAHIGGLLGGAILSFVFSIPKHVPGGKLSGVHE